MTELEIENIVNESCERWSVSAVTVIHRIGKLLPSDQIVFVGVASKHRQDSFNACNFVMDWLKTQAPFWKIEDDGNKKKWVEFNSLDSDALMLDYRGQIAEATGANIFFKMPDGKLHTPLADCFLDGITRRTVIGLAKASGIEVVERKIMPEEMSDAEECFLTGTAAEVTPVQSIGDYKFTPGEICLKLTDAYNKLVNEK